MKSPYAEPSRGRRVAWTLYALVFGVGGAAWCFHQAWIGAWFGTWSASSCVYAAVCMVALCVALSTSRRSPTADSVLVGVLSSALFVAVPFGLLLGVLCVAGVLTRTLSFDSPGAWFIGITLPPIACTQIYGREAQLAFRRIKASNVDSFWMLAGLFLAPLAGFGCRIVQDRLVEATFERVLTDDPADETAWIALTRPFVYHCELADWRTAWNAARSANTPAELERAARIARAHFALTGNSLEDDSD
ncbi:MAG: hypothetical protein L6Q99_22150 [Planctomycetes bacterium]|nr:hypothetical protein [Planctomycetota bacterium]